MTADEHDPAQERPMIGVTGATGYVGGRLVPALLESGFRVRCIVREPRKLEDRPWRPHPDVSIATSDLSDQDSLIDALRGCEAAYYLVHSMETSSARYAERDRDLATNFAKSAAAAGVGRIIYLGGLGEMGKGLSEHLSSRREVETLLGSTGVPVTTVRAAMIIGSGSASFEILRYLVERLPVMVTPSWVRTESQPVAIDDVLHWLVRCLRTPGTIGQTLEIGGADVVRYTELMHIMAEELGLRRRVIFPMPVLTPRLSSGWISLVTPVSFRIARPLAEGLRNRVVVTSDAAQQLMPHPAMGVREAIRTSLVQTRSHEVLTRWSAAGPVPGDPDWAGGTVFKDERSIEIDAEPAGVFAAVCRIGGGHGWYAGDILWKIRGWMDTLVGGPGLRRGRRHPDRVEYGEALDFWRVIGVQQDRSLRLLAEMKLPGTATLEFDIEPLGLGDSPRSRLTMTARFRPRGLLGLMYWYAVLPLHNFVFGGMVKGVRREAERASRNTSSDASGGPMHEETGSTLVAGR
ncbi:MAG: SDR family oxidoreductase [Phycisphaeraceae bacterium]|nr:SDR family oxidoreductase [Phycisphaeraceae bacterium]